MSTRSPGTSGGDHRTSTPGAPDPGKTRSRATRPTEARPARTRSAKSPAPPAPEPPPPAAPVTGADVARAAGVSRATVSYAMNDTADARIPQETRRRVREIARRLGYEPRSDARSLRRGRTDLVVLPTYPIPFGGLLTSFVGGLSRELHRLGHTLVTYGDPDAGPMEAARSWAALRPAAVVVLPQRLTEESAAYLTARGVAIVALGWGNAPTPGASLVLRGDTGQAGRAGAAHLLARGHRDIAVVVPREGRDEVFGLAALGRERLAAVHETVAAFPQTVRVRVVEMAESAEFAADVVAGWPPDDRPEAVYGYNDEYAALLMGAMWDAGIRVPQDIAVIGTDDLPLCDMVRPRLTSVGFTPAVAMAEVARRIADTVKAPAPGAAAPIVMWDAELRQRDSA